MKKTERTSLIKQFAAGAWHAPAGAPAHQPGGLIAEEDADLFVHISSAVIASARRGEVLERALVIMLQSAAAPLELSFIGLFAALESVLTFSRHPGDYGILPQREFERLERGLKVCLRRDLTLADDAQSRRLIYEKLRELNRFPFSYVFRRFCAQRGLDLSDLWPVFGPAAEWPLVEIRHRLVHGDPFLRRPAAALECARTHLRWTTARMLLAALRWPIERSRVDPASLARAGGAYRNWRKERAKLS